jgi:class 3 adenylate cyclase
VVEHDMSGPARVCASCGNENPAGARFCFSCGAPLEASTPVAETRKTVTVLFCDLVGSTAMGEQIDPETLRGLLARSFERVQAIVEGHGGVVEKFIGDAAMAVFGIPRVHEDDALRAVRAAAEIREALESSAGGATGATVAWRTGIATGEVVAGNAAAGQRLVTGDAVNVAARLQQSAQPGEILITADTHRLVRDAIKAEPLGEVSVKGRQAPIETFRLESVDRSAAGHERRLDSPMVGRERPRRLLGDAFAEVRDQRICHLFTVLGPAGVGKSRLVNEFLASVGDEARVVRGRCLSYGEGITYWPIGEIVRGALGLGATGSDPLEGRGRIREVVADHDDADRIADVVSEAIGLTRVGTSSDETPWAVRSFLEALAADRPLIVVLDDLQWAQPPLLDLVDHISDWSRNAGILLVVLARQELLEARPAWGGGKRSATSISLEPLNVEETAELIDNLLGRADLPPTAFDRIRAAAEGNPLFVEELLEMLIDEGVLARSDGSWTARGDLAALSVPPTIQALLAARLDGLAGSERAILERGAVEGTLFHRDAVAALAPESLREDVGPSLMTLTRREFVAPDRGELAGREAFRFRHQLIRDAAYQAIAKQSRAELHERFAGWLAEALGPRVEEYRTIVGYHLEQAARYRRELDPRDPLLASIERRAVEQLGAAGMAALDRADAATASNLLSRVLALVHDDAETVRWRLAASEGLERMVSATEANEFILETGELATRLGDARSATVAEALRLHVRSALGESISDLVQDGERIRAELLAQGDAEGSARAGIELSKGWFWSGRAADAFALAEEVIAAPRTPSRIRSEATGWQMAYAFWGPMPVVDALTRIEDNLAEPDLPRFAILRAGRSRCALLAMLGRFGESRQVSDAIQAQHEEFGDRTLIGSLKGHFLGPARFLEGTFDEAAQLGIESYELLMAQGHVGFANTSAAYAARALLAGGRLAEAEEWAQRALDIGADDDLAAAAPALGVLARTHASRGATDAIELADRAVAFWTNADHLDLMGDTRLDRAETYHLFGREADAQVEMAAALELFERKGNVVSAGVARDRLAEWGAASSD